MSNAFVGSRSLDIKESSISIKLPESLLIKAREAAEKSSLFYSAKVDVVKSPYGGNDVERHFMGKIGEYGVEYLLTRLAARNKQELTIDAVFTDPARDSECDIIVNGHRVEVKTWRPVDYDRFGPCIAERQAKKLAKKCSLILYVTYNSSTNDYVFRGWNNVTDVDGVEPVLTGRPGKQVLNRVMTPRVVTDLPFMRKVE